MEIKFKNWAIKLVIICVLVYVLQLIFPGFTDFFLLTQQHPLQIWRYLTAIFLHASLGHLVLNMFALGIFGFILERMIGSRNFLITFFVTGIIANLISINFYDSSLGASGAIFGVIGALVLIRPLMVVWAFGLPMPMFIAAILWAVLDVIGVFVPSGTANIAHLSGLAIGLIIGAIYREWGSKKEQQLRVIKIDEDSIRRWEDAYMR